MSGLFSALASRSEQGLSRRVEELDTEPLCGWERGRNVTCGVGQHAAARLEHFVDVMSRWTDTFIETEVDPHATVTPGAADAIASRSRLLTEIEQFDPSLMTGPIQRDKQRWTSIGRSAHSGEPPSEQRFIVPQADQPAECKPFWCGMYTSTASAGGLSMWRTLLGPDGSMMYPLPWHTWEINVDDSATVAEIASATNWAELVCAHPQYADGRLYPDWVSISRRFDAVHITLPTIAAAQGFALMTAQGTISPVFWDVETTFWLRWCFSGARLVEIVDDSPSELPHG